MYATATGSLASMFRARNMSNVYRQISVETGIEGASSHQLITMLFNGALDAISQGKGAMLERRIEAKCEALTKAVRIVDEGLKAGLDRQRGGELAQNLFDLYAYITMRLTQANLRNDPAALDECANLIQPISEAWIAIGPSQSGQQEPRTSMELHA